MEQKGEKPISKKIMINGHTISHDVADGSGARHLLHGGEETKEIFDIAYRKGKAKFKDYRGFKYKLVYHNGRYQVEKS